MTTVKKKPHFHAVAGSCGTSICHLALASPNALADFLLCMRSKSSWLWCFPTLRWNYWTLASRFHLLTNPVLVWESSSLPMMWISGTSWNQTTRPSQAELYILYIVDCWWRRFAVYMLCFALKHWTVCSDVELFVSVRLGTVGLCHFGAKGTCYHPHSPEKGYVELAFWNFLPWKCYCLFCLWLRSLKLSIARHHLLIRSRNHSQQWEQVMVPYLTNEVHFKIMF